jgi:uncharacterized protein YggE
MPRALIAAAVALILFFPSVLVQAQIRQPPQGRVQNQKGTQSQNFQDHVITVSRGGEAYAKPDLGILVMSIQSSSPIAEESVAENGRKAKAVEAALAGLGFAPDGYQITSVSFGQAGGAHYGPAQPAATAYQVTQSVYVFFTVADLSDMARLTEKSASVIEALRKAGAVPGNAGGSFLGIPQGAPLIIYTIKDSDPYEKQASQLAIARARDDAQDIATATGVKIAGLKSVISTFLYGDYGPRAGQGSPENSSLQGLHYRWFSTNSDQVEIGASTTVEYNFQ